MEDKMLMNQLIQKVKEYAHIRKDAVERGAESPHLAALLLQKYGLGMVDAISIIYDNNRASDPIYKVVDEEVERIDPNWRQNARLRWSGEPADITMNNSNLNTIPSNND